MNEAEIMQWASLIEMCLAVGVKSWNAIKVLGNNAGLDDDALEQLKPHWDVLYSDVKRSAGL